MQETDTELYDEKHGSERNHKRTVFGNVVVLYGFDIAILGQNSHLLSLISFVMVIFVAYTSWLLINKLEMFGVAATMLKQHEAIVENKYSCKGNFFSEKITKD